MYQSIPLNNNNQMSALSEHKLTFFEAISYNWEHLRFEITMFFVATNIYNKKETKSNSYLFLHYYENIQVEKSTIRKETNQTTQSKSNVVKFEL